jgi:organic radical activating enzyme
MNNNLKDIKHIYVSEMFYSLQGEGKTMGVPSLFLRTQYCNQSCKWCDTIEVWKHGVPYISKEIIDKWKDEKWYNKLIKGTHLVITGGEPLTQQKNLISLLQDLPLNVYKEVETAGTIKPEERFDKLINQYNVSPKLENSGMKKNVRHKEDVLDYFSKNEKANFKFVIDNQDDLYEVIDDFINKFKIDNSDVWLMPQGSSRKELEVKREWLAEICKLYNFNYSDRLQVVIWDRTTGV